MKNVSKILCPKLNSIFPCFVEKLAKNFPRQYRTPVFSQVIDKHLRQGPPFEQFSDIQFWLTDPKIFLKVPLAPVYSYFKGGVRAKKTPFCLFFKILPLGAEILAKTGNF